MPNPIDSPDYWIEDFRPSNADLEMLYGVVLEAGRPIALESLAATLVRHHVQQIVDRRKSAKKAGGAVYQPTDRYEPKQKLVFPALDGAHGMVESVRPGNNPAYGTYDVVQVRIDGRLREFAAGLEWAHPLAGTDMDVDPEALARRYDAVVAPQLESRLAADKEWLRSGDRWILKALLPAVNTGHLNLAEAVIMLAGEPLPAEQVLTELGLDPAVPLETQVVALEMAMAGDERFRNVGAIESPLWTITTQM